MSRQCVAGVIWEAVYFNLPPGNQTSTRENNLTKLGCGQSFSSYVLNYIHNTLPKAQGTQGFSFFCLSYCPNNYIRPIWSSDKPYMQKTCVVAEMAILAKKNCGKSA